MRHKREKGYWVKKKEILSSGKEAKQRAGEIRLNEHTAHVIMNKKRDQYFVEYSIAKWYLEECKKLGINI